MSTKFFCNSDTCTDPDKGPFVLELPNEAVMDGNNMATIFCPKCNNAMKPLPHHHQHDDQQRFYCHNEACGHNEELFFIDLSTEAIMDNNNLATIFCPKCGKEMHSFGQAPNTAANG